MNNVKLSDRKVGKDQTEAEARVTILIVDDDDDDMQLFIESAKEVGENIHCVGVYDGQQALLHLNDEKNILPDYIFLDLNMPRINGKKCLEQIKKTERLSHIPVIIYTTTRELEEAKELKRLGAAHFISKPSLPDEIFYHISFVLGEKWD
jgi:CheY-like chemotaxis protein